MVSSTKSIVAFAFFLTQLFPSMVTAIETLPQSESGTIPARLRSTSPEQKRGLVARDSCLIGEHACSDGFGCCLVTEYCGTWGGVPGCCPTGKTCVASDDPCIYKGDVLCPGETFCCPKGDTCSRTLSGAPKCTYIPGGGLGSYKSTTLSTSSTSSRTTATGGVLGAQTSSSSSSSSTGASSNGSTNPLNATQGGGALANTVAGSSVALILASMVAMLVAA